MDVFRSLVDVFRPLVDVFRPFVGAEVCFHCGSDKANLEECGCCGEMACDGYGDEE